MATPFGYHQMSAEEREYEMKCLYFDPYKEDKEKHLISSENADVRRREMDRLIGANAMCEVDENGDTTLERLTRNFELNTAHSLGTLMYKCCGSRIGRCTDKGRPVVTARMFEETFLPSPLSRGVCRDGTTYRAVGAEDCRLWTAMREAKRREASRNAAAARRKACAQLEPENRRRHMRSVNYMYSLVREVQSKDCEGRNEPVAWQRLAEEFCIARRHGLKMFGIDHKEYKKAIEALWQAERERKKKQNVTKNEDHYLLNHTSLKYLCGRGSIKDLDSDPHISMWRDVFEFSSDESGVGYWRIREGAEAECTQQGVYIVYTEAVIDADLASREERRELPWYEEGRRGRERGEKTNVFKRGKDSESEEEKEQEQVEEVVEQRREQRMEEEFRPVERQQQGSGGFAMSRMDEEKEKEEQEGQPVEVEQSKDHLGGFGFVFRGEEEEKEPVTVSDEETYYSGVEGEGGERMARSPLSDSDISDDEAIVSPHLSSCSDEDEMERRVERKKDKRRKTEQRNRDKAARRLARQKKLERRSRRDGVETREQKEREGKEEEGEEESDEEVLGIHAGSPRKTERPLAPLVVLEDVWDSEEDEEEEEMEEEQQVGEEQPTQHGEGEDSDVKILGIHDNTEDDSESFSVPVAFDQLEEREKALLEREQAMGEREQEQVRREQALEQREEQLQRNESAVLAWQTGLERREEVTEQARRALDQLSREMEQSRQRVQRHEANMQHRERFILEREQDVERRERAVGEREQSAAQAREKEQEQEEGQEEGQGGLRGFAAHLVGAIVACVRLHHDRYAKKVPLARLPMILQVTSGEYISFEDIYGCGMREVIERHCSQWVEIVDDARSGTVDLRYKDGE